MTRPVLLAALLVAPIGASADPNNEPARASTEPPGVPLELRVRAEAAYDLWTGGVPRDKYVHKIEAAKKTGNFPEATPLHMELVIVNTSRNPIQLWVSGDATQFGVELRGPAAIEVKAPRKLRAESTPLKSVMLGPGKSYTIPVAQLSHGYRGEEKRTYITDIGRYEMTVSFQTAILPAPKDARLRQGGFGEVTLKAAPVRFRVLKPS